MISGAESLLKKWQRLQVWREKSQTSRLGPSTKQEIDMESRRFVWTREKKLKHAQKFSSTAMRSWSFMNPVVHRTEAFRKSPLNLLMSCKKPWDFRVTKTWGHSFFSVNSTTLKQVWLRGWCTATYTCHINFAIICPSTTEPMKNSEANAKGLQLYKYLDVRCFITL